MLSIRICVASERKYKDWQYFCWGKKKENNFALELVAYVYEDNKGQINLDPESEKKSVKKEIWEKNFVHCQD